MVPSKSSLYSHRINLDLATMLFARKKHFHVSSGLPWCVHIRTDSSPQFGKNYLNGEADILKLDQIHTFSDVPKALCTRMLVTQLVGSRASDAVDAKLHLADIFFVNPTSDS